MRKKATPVPSSVTIRVNEKWDRGVGQAAERRGLSKSAFIRSCAELRSSLDKRAPYACLNSSSYLEITSCGDFIIRAVECLQSKANKLDYLQASVPMKYEGKESVFSGTSGDDLEKIKSKWLFNQFSLWSENPDANPSATPLICASDKKGVTGKSCRLSYQIPPHTTFWRESVAWIENYARRSSSIHEDDYVDFPVGIHTEKVQITAIIDRGLFCGIGGTGMKSEPSLHLVWRNRDLVPFLETPYNDAFAIEKVSARISEESKPIRDGALQSVFQRAIKNREAVASRMLAIGHHVPALPKDFLIYGADIPWPDTEVVPSLTWPMPWVDSTG